MSRALHTFEHLQGQQLEQTSHRRLTAVNWRVLFDDALLSPHPVAWMAMNDEKKWPASGTCELFLEVVPPPPPPPSQRFYSARSPLWSEPLPGRKAPLCVFCFLLLLISFWFCADLDLMLVDPTRFDYHFRYHCHYAWLLALLQKYLTTLPPSPVCSARFRSFIDNRLFVILFIINFLKIWRQRWCSKVSTAIPYGSWRCFLAGDHRRG